MRIFSGFDRRQAEAVEVFAHSVREQASIPVEITPLRLEELPLKRKGVTDFTYSRFLVPHLCGYQGRAVFGDGADQLCLGDVSELAEWDMEGKPIWVVKHRVAGQARPRSWTSLMLMDCARLKFWTPRSAQEAPDDQLMRIADLSDDKIGALPEAWNQLLQPGEEPPEGTKIAHFSCLSDPDIGPWIDASRSKTWAEARERWRQSSSGGFLSAVGQAGPSSSSPEVRH